MAPLRFRVAGDLGVFSALLLSRVALFVRDAVDFRAVPDLLAAPSAGLALEEDAFRDAPAAEREPDARVAFAPAVALRVEPDVDREPELRVAFAPADAFRDEVAFAPLARRGELRLVDDVDEAAPAVEPDASSLVHFPDMTR